MEILLNILWNKKMIDISFNKLYLLHINEPVLDFGQAFPTFHTVNLFEIERKLHTITLMKQMRKL